MTIDLIAQLLYLLPLLYCGKRLTVLLAGSVPELFLIDGEPQPLNLLVCLAVSGFQIALCATEEPVVVHKPNEVDLVLGEGLVKHAKVGVSEEEKRIVHQRQASIRGAKRVQHTSQQIDLDSVL